MRLKKRRNACKCYRINISNRNIERNEKKDSKKQRKNAFLNMYIKKEAIDETSV